MFRTTAEVNTQVSVLAFPIVVFPSHCKSVAVLIDPEISTSAPIFNAGI
jgi:hypothetical protein